MPKRKPLLALAATVAVLAITGCGSAPGGTAAGSTTNSAAAIQAAKALGINLADCPADETTKFGPKENIGLTLPLTGGPASAFAVLGPGAAAAIAQGNAIDGLSTKFNLIQKDDQFMPDKTLADVQEMIQKDHIVSVTGVTGTPGVMAIRDLLRQQCLPGIGLAGGGSGVSDPAYPEMLQAALPFSLDVRVWVQNVNKTYPNGAKIATFIGNTASGTDYEAQIKKWLAATHSKSQIVSQQTIDETDAASPASQVTTMRNSKANVLFAAPTGAQCISMMTEMANQGWKPATYLTTNCASSAYFTPAGAAANGVFVVQAFKDVNSPRFKNDPGLKSVREALQKYAPNADLENTTTYSGYSYAETFMEVAKAAAKSPLGLSKLGLIVAARSLDFHPAVLVNGVDFKTDGLKDMVPIESAELNTWSVAKGGFVKGKLYNFEGQLTE
jgi:branched-chain amino acid transport system substrate-binding protein